MNVQEMLGELDLGNSVAEFEQDLERYFVETDVFRVLAEARADIITGDRRGIRGILRGGSPCAAGSFANLSGPP